MREKNYALFPFNGNRVQVYVVDDQELFDATDVCWALGFTDVLKAIEELEYMVIRNRITGDEIYTLPERSVWALCMDSETEEAKKFQHWVLKELVPTIDKTGCYYGGNWRE